MWDELNPSYLCSTKMMVIWLSWTEIDLGRGIVAAFYMGN
jgi:hypothetical protein